MTVRGRLDRVDGSTSHPILHLVASGDRTLFLSYEPKQTEATAAEPISIVGGFPQRLPSAP